MKIRIKVETIPFGNEDLRYEIDQFTLDLPREYNEDDAIDWVRGELEVEPDEKE